MAAGNGEDKEYVRRIRCDYMTDKDEVIRTNRGLYPSLMVPRVVRHMQDDEYSTGGRNGVACRKAVIFDEVSGELHAVVKSVWRRGIPEILTIYERDPRVTWDVKERAAREKEK